MYNGSSSSPTLTNCTFSGNAASSFGGGLYCSSSSQTIVNCVLWGNTATNGPQIYQSGGTITVTYSDIQQTGGVYTGIGNINADPMFVRNPSSGSDGTWATADDDYGDLHVQIGSPTIDAGNNNVSGLTGVTTDLGGGNRFQDIPAVPDTGVGTTPIVDMGAYETVPVLAADAGGSYVGIQGRDLILNGRGGSTVAGALQYAWEWTGDNSFDDGTGPNPLFPTTIWGALTSVIVFLRVTDAVGGTAFDSATVQIVCPVFVDDTATGANDGTSWNNAYVSLQTAMAAATSGQTVLVGQGTYKPTTGSDRSTSFVLKTGVAIYGGYAGVGTADSFARDISRHASVLSGDIGVTGTNSDNSYHVVVGSGTGSTAILDGFTITAGNATDDNSNPFGGGVYNSSGSPTLANCTLIGNTALSAGGMSNDFASSPTLTNCAFIGNSASFNGGGMYNGNSSSPVLDNCTFTGNIGYTGGEIYNFSSNPKLTNCIIRSGGISPIFNRSSTPLITYSDVQGGYAGAGNIDADPLFVRSPWTGPDGVFGTADDDCGDLRLRAGSPALDMGSNVAIPAGVTTDPAGHDRIENGTVDMGAYEGPVCVSVAKSIYVDLVAAGADTGASWADAYTSLQSALLEAVDGDTIRIANGTYLPTSTTDRTMSFALRQAVGIYGGYAGYGASDPDARDAAVQLTILSGDIGAIGDIDDNSYHVLTATGVGSLAVLDGVTVTRGKADGSGSSRSNGGGLLAMGGSPTLARCTFTGNWASNGGGLYNSAGAAPKLINCAITGNSASDGGGLYNSASAVPKLTNCTLISNAAWFGSAIYNDASCSPTLTNCIVWGNSNSPVYSSLGTSTITYSDIQGGYAGVGNISADPLLVRFPWTGPDGLFGTADDDLGDLRLRANSPALDVGSNAAIPADSTTDLGGNVRIQNGMADLGAYEGLTSAPVPKTVYVDLAAVGANIGTSWIDAFTSLQSALRETSDGDTILIADGTYKPTTIIDRTIGFALRNAVAIYGGYAGDGAPDPNAHDRVVYPTVLSGDTGTTDDISDNNYHVVTARGAGSLTILDGVTVIGGHADGSGAGQSKGGGLLATGSSPTLTNCTFSGNSAASGGGGIFNNCGSPTLTNCVFSGNSVNGTYGHGGGMYNNYYSSPILSGCTFIANSATGAYGYGGGMYNYNFASPTLANCVFNGNSATGAGGIGGGMFNSSSSPTLTNCVLVGNGALSGGGMYNSSSSNPDLRNCTMSGNWAFAYGGGMYNASSKPTLTNCIVWGGGTSPVYDNSSTPVITYSSIQGGYTGTGNINADPLFVRSPWTGPDGQFGTADDDYGDLRLRAGSPALDIGSNTAIPTGVTTDLDGNARIENGTVDIGAYEGPVAVPAAKTIYVDLNATGTNGGTSWTDAFTGLQSAFLAATDGDTVRIADGTYKPTTTTERTVGFALRNAVPVYGGYAGFGASDPDARDIVAYRTILSGDLGIAGINTDNSYHVLTATVVGSATVLEGVTVEEGNAGGSSFGQDQGGGVLIVSSTLTLRDCTFSDNSASSGGGGMYSAASSPTLTNCTFGRNVTAGFGGGMRNFSCYSPTLTNCAFQGNSASQGGGIYNYASSPKLTNCTFSGNSVPFSTGGGMCNESVSSPVLTNCTFSGNLSSSSGGGMANYSSNPILTNCIIWGSGNSPIQNSSSTPVITYSDIQKASGVYTGTGNINADPVFVRNPSSGADGKWGTGDDDYGDLRLLSASPAINVGSNAAVPAGVTTDLAGNPRIVGAAVDMGAYEYSPTVLTFVGTAGNDAVYARLSEDQTQFQVWSGAGFDGSLLGSYAVAGSPGFVFDVGGGSNSLVLDISNGVSSVPINLVGGAGTDTITLMGIGAASAVNAQAGKIVVGAKTVYTPGVEAVVLDAAAGSAIGLASLTVGTAVSVAAGKGLVLRTSSLSITGAGSLDLAGNSMILDYSSSPMAQVRGWIRNGRMGATPALKSTGALGMVDNALVHQTSFAGQALGGVFSQLLIQATVAGDTNLDGKVDASDYLNVIANMGRTNAQWFLGDLNCDGVVTADDLAEVSGNLSGDVAFAAKKKDQEIKGSKVQGGTSQKKVQGFKSSNAQGGKSLTKVQGIKGSKVQKFKRGRI